MKAGNAGSLYNNLEEFSKEDYGEYVCEFDSGNSHTIYHTQFATYQIEPLVDLIKEALMQCKTELGVTDKTEQISYDDLLDNTREISREVEDHVSDTRFTSDNNGLFIENTMVRPMYVFDSMTILDIFEDVEIESLEKFACDILTVYNYELARREIHLEREKAKRSYQRDNDVKNAEREVSEIMVAVSDLIKKHHERDLFSTPNIDPITVYELWDIIEGTEFDEGEHKWLYALFIDQKDPFNYAPSDAISKEIMSIMFGSFIPTSQEKYEKWESENEPDIEDVKKDEENAEI